MPGSTPVRSRSRGLILLYHRVAEPAFDPWAMAVPPARFEEQLGVLQAGFTVLGLEELLAAAVADRLPERAVAVTFDDGYVDNLHVAKPLLEANEIPATMFVPTGTIGSRREYWWDELERVVLRSPDLPEELTLRVDGREHRWHLGDAAKRPTDASHRGWRAWGEPDPTARHGLFRSLYDLLYGLPERERLSVQDDLLSLAGVPAIPEEQDRRVMSEGELVALGRGPLLSVGAHTVSHPLLSSAPPEVQRREVQRGRDELERLLGRPVTTFAYPFGKKGDYTPETVAIVRSAGFACACANVPGTVDRGSDPFQLPRMYVFDWDGDAFAARMIEWFESP